MRLVCKNSDGNNPHFIEEGSEAFSAHKEGELRKIICKDCVEQMKQQGWTVTPIPGFFQVPPDAGPSFID